MAYHKFASLNCNCIKHLVILYDLFGCETPFRWADVKKATGKLVPAGIATLFIREKLVIKHSENGRGGKRIVRWTVSLDIPECIDKYSWREKVGMVKCSD